MSLIKLWHKKNGSHQTKKYLLPLFTAVCVAALFFTGCANSTDSIDSSDSKKETFTITVKTQNITSTKEAEGRSIFPVLSASENYSLSYKSGESEDWQNLDGTFPEYQMFIIPETYTLKLDAYSDEEKQNHILTGQTELTVTSGMENAEVLFIMQPPENAIGNGSVSLILSAESDTKIDKFEITADSGNLSLVWAKDDTETTYTKGTITAASVPNGTYHLTIYGKTTAGETIYVRSETLTVWSGLESNVWIFADGSSSNELKITASDLYSTFYVKGSSDSCNFYKDDVFGDVTASDTNSGSMDSPLSTISTAIAKCTVANKPYTINIDGTFETNTTIDILEDMNITINALGTPQNTDTTNTRPVINFNITGEPGITARKNTVLSMNNIVMDGLQKDGGGCGVFSFGNELNLSGCTVKDFKEGGICAGGKVSLLNCSIIDNESSSTGTGINFSGTSLKITGCKIQGNNKNTTDTNQNGGGIYIDSADAVVTISDSTINENNAQNGAGIYLNSGTLTISSTTMESNTATGDAGALCINNGSVTLTDCTFSGNTTTSNGKAVYFADGTLNLNGKIQSSTDDFYIPTGKIITIQTSLSDDSSVLVIPSAYSNNTQVLQAEDGVTLADEAGKIKISNPDYIISKEGKLCYLGTTSTTAADNIAVFTNIPAGGEATVNLDNLAQTTWNNHSSIEINGKVTVKATKPTTINSEASCIFTVKKVGTLTLSDKVTLNNTSANPSSCVKVEEGGTLILDGAKITLTSTTGPVGISITNGTLIMNSGTISGMHGPAIVATDSEITITDGTISNNNGSGSRSTINLKNCTADIKNLTVTNNYANWYGGGIMISGGGTYTFTNCEISNNSTGYSNGAPGYGGGIYIDTTGTVTFTGCTITGNSAINNGSSSKGGGIYLKSGTLTTTNCTISSNTTKNGSTETSGYGSQIYAVAGSVYNGETLAAYMVIDEYSE